MTGLRACLRCGAELSEIKPQRTCDNCKYFYRQKARNRTMVNVMGKLKRWDNCTFLEKVMCYREEDPRTIAEKAYELRLKRRDRGAISRLH